MNLSDFFNKWNNRGCDFDGFYGFQCVDLYRQYCQDVLQVPKSPSIHGAAEIWDTYLKNYFVRIPNTPTGIPKLGDIVIWDKKLNGYGHVAIFNNGDAKSFTSFDQNFPSGTPCHFQNHSYKSVLGWLRLKNNPISVKKLNPFKIAVINGNQPQIDEFLAKVAEYTQNKLSCVLGQFQANISVPQGTLGGDQAVKVINDLGIKDVQGVFIFYPATPTSVYEVASYYPEKNLSFATCPSPISTTILVHAFLHLLRKYYNFNHLGPYIEDVEKYPTSWSDAGNFNNPGWKFVEQYQQLSPYF